MHQVEGAIPSALTISSLWCSSVNMPASHAGDHRSEAGQGRQFHRALKALSAMRFLGTEVSLVQFRVRAPITQSSQCSSGFHKPALSGAAPETATNLPPCSSLRTSFVKKLCRGSTGWRLQFEYLSGEWLRGNSRPRRSRVCEPWRCKSSLAHHLFRS